MIVVKLMGGHSNQMFQYAVGRNLAHRNNTKLLLDLSWFDNTNSVDSPRNYELGSYNIVENFYKKTLTTRLAKKLGIMKVYKESSLTFDGSVLELGPNVYLDGYFQSEKYFKDGREMLLQDFTYKKTATGKNKELLEQIEQDPFSVSLHVRRGDYVDNKNANLFHGVKDSSYYDRALEILTKTVKQPNIYVISNDPEWCKENLKFSYNTYYVDNNDDATQGCEDMRLMRACKHNILANSSFSWWGAWLNNNPNKIVVAPRQWFEDKTANSSDIVPKEWIQA